MALTNTDLFVVERGGTNYKMAADQLTAKTSATGASIIPSGTTAERPGTPVIGYSRYNTSLGNFEIYTGPTASWNQVAWVPAPDALPADLTFSANAIIAGTYVCNNLTVNAGVTLSQASQDVIFICYGDVNIAGDIVGVGVGPAGGASTQAYIQSQAGDELIVRANAGLGFGGLGTIIPYTPLGSFLGSGGLSQLAQVKPVDINFTGVITGEGASSGGSLGIRSNTSITVTGSINMSAGPVGFPQAGFQNYWFLSGNGGGSGGCIALKAAGNITLNGATLSVKGSNGGNAASSDAFRARAGGGGGGSGGWIILESSGTVTNTGSVIEIQGGVGGVGLNGGGSILSSLGGSNGATFAGAGGTGGNEIGGTGGTGGAGQVVFAGCPF
jgi:hypothetical protein